ncbi:MAG: amidase [Chloroflexi bacterium]|jgi:aspartyl-tRNA(Asn)/glutamyl-tRNA(Gln) amidotransferase subunit A|nr:amidase [Chloroflexota bacterium]MDA1282341.1 amidase [Chloroflexota bacterium]
MNDRELMFTPAHKQRQMIVDGEISSVEMTKASLRRIAELEPQLNAFITLDEQGALAAAKAADESLASGLTPGPLHGVPIAVKDLEVTKGLRTTLGSTFFEDWIPDYDSVAVERLRASGAVILGKTNTPEFGNREETFTNVAPTCNNPWDPARMPGGSSGGTAAAIASGMCSIGTGSDGGGSVRLPASFCGIFGHKPTHGRIPRFGGQAKPAYNSAGTSGPMSNDVRDSAILNQALAGFDARDPGSVKAAVPDYLAKLEDGVKGMRIGTTMTLGISDVNLDVAAAVEESWSAFSELGANVEPVDIKFDPVPRDAWWTLWTAGQVAMYGHLAEERPEDLMPYTLDMINHGKTLSGADVSAALRDVQNLQLKMHQLFEEYDLVLAPTNAAVAWPHLDPPSQIGTKSNDDEMAGINYGAIPFTMVFNSSFNPASSIPAGFGEGGMPVGLQIIGAYDDDATVYRGSRAFEIARPWSGTRPQVS